MRWLVAVAVAARVAVAAQVDARFVSLKFADEVHIFCVVEDLSSVEGLGDLEESASEVAKSTNHGCLMEVPLKGQKGQNPVPWGFALGAVSYMAEFGTCTEGNVLSCSVDEDGTTFANKYEPRPPDNDPILESIDALGRWTSPKYPKLAQAAFDWRDHWEENSQRAWVAVEHGLAVYQKKPGENGSVSELWGTTTPEYRETLEKNWPKPPKEKLKIAAGLRLDSPKGLLGVVEQLLRGEVQEVSKSVTVTTGEGPSIERKALALTGYGVRVVNDPLPTDSDRQANQRKKMKKRTRKQNRLRRRKRRMR